MPLRQFGCRASVDLLLQPPGRDYTIPYSFSLVALSAPAGEVFAGILSEQPLAAGTQDVTLPAARTFDWYIEESPVIEVVPRPSDKVLAFIARRSQAMHMLVRSAGDTPIMIWDDIDDAIEHDAVPNGEMRHTSDEPISLRCTLSLSEGGTARGAEVVVETLRPEEPDASSRRNIQYLYVAVDEMLASGATIRTYFDVSMNRQMHVVPSWFFDKEHECIDQTERLIDHINDRFSEQATQLPPWVPRSRFTLLTHAQRLLQDSPEVVAQAIREISDG